MSQLQRSAVIAVLCLLCMLSSLCSRWTTATQQGAVVLALVSHDAAPYQQALAGLQRAVASHGTFDIHALQGSRDQAALVLQHWQQHPARVVVTLGALATQAVDDAGVSLPLTACLLLDTEEIKKNPHATGVVLEFPLALQLQWIQRIIPSARTIGVLYNPQENRSKVEAAMLLARQHNLRLEAREIQTPKDIPGALESLENKIDVLWGLVDSLVLNPQTAKALLLFSFRQRIPFVGPSKAWVKAGALYALEWDYEDLGAQCGELVLRLLKGERASTIPPQSPRKVYHSLNRRTADHMHIDFSTILRRDAQEIFD